MIIGQSQISTKFIVWLVFANLRFCDRRNFRQKWWAAVVVVVVVVGNKKLKNQHFGRRRREKIKLEMMSKQTINVKSVVVVFIVVIVMIMSFNVEASQRRNYRLTSERQSCQAIVDCDACIKNPKCAWCKKSNGLSHVKIHSITWKLVKMPLTEQIQGFNTISKPPKNSFFNSCELKML